RTHAARTPGEGAFRAHVHRRVRHLRTHACAGAHRPPAALLRFVRVLVLGRGAAAARVHHGGGDRDGGGAGPFLVPIWVEPAVGRSGEREPVAGDDARMDRGFAAAAR